MQFSASHHVYILYAYICTCIYVLKSNTCIFICWRTHVHTYTCTKRSSPSPGAEKLNFFQGIKVLKHSEDTPAWRDRLWATWKAGWATQRHKATDGHTSPAYCCSQAAYRWPISHYDTNFHLMQTNKRPIFCQSLARRDWHPKWRRLIADSKLNRTRVNRLNKNAKKLVWCCLYPADIGTIQIIGATKVQDQ